MRNTRFASRQAASWLTLGIFLGAGFCLSLSAPAARAQQDQTSLGDIARQLRSEKKNEPAGKTFNNENLPKTEAGISIVGTVHEPAAEEKPATETPKESTVPANAVAPNGETSRLSIQHEMDEAVKQKDELLKQIDLSERDYKLAEDQLLQNANFASDRDGQAHLAELRQGIDDQKATLDKLNGHIADLQERLDTMHAPGGATTNPGSSNGSAPTRN